MDFNRIKTPLTCLIGSMALMGIIYSAFFGVESIKGAIVVSMAFIAIMSWKIIYFIFGSIILCLECMIFNKYERVSKLHLNIISAVLLLFTILCGISNYDVFDWKATLFGLLLYGLSRGVIEFKEIPKEQKENRYFGILILCLIFLLLVTVLFADDKDFPNKKESIKVENNSAIISEKVEIIKETSLEKVNNKYKDEFKKLGFINIFKENKIYDKYTYVIDNFSMEKDHNLVTSGEAAKVISNEASNQIYFGNITLKLSNDKLIISGLEYDKKMISQEKVATALNAVMEKVVMPKLRIIEKEIKLQRDNLESYKK
jgi:hypothetical protein